MKVLSCFHSSFHFHCSTFNSPQMMNVKTLPNPGHYVLSYSIKMHPLPGVYTKYGITFVWTPSVTDRVVLLSFLGRFEASLDTCALIEPVILCRCLVSTFG